LLALRPKIAKVGPYHGAQLGFYAEVFSPGQAPADLAREFADPVPFGGEGRYVTVSPLDKPVAWPHCEGVGDRALWLLATPGIFAIGSSKQCWQPDQILSTQLKAAASGSPLAVSGWDIARNGPKPTRFAVPAGSVYYVKNVSLPIHASLCGDEEDVAQGWGYALQGVWK
jgi:CRISPR-associated protein Cmr3